MSKPLSVHRYGPWLMYWLCAHSPANHQAYNTDTMYRQHTVQCLCVAWYLRHSCTLLISHRDKLCVYHMLAEKSYFKLMLSNKEHSTPNYIPCIVFSSYISSFFTLKIRLLGAKLVWLAFILTAAETNILLMVTEDK